LGREPISGVPPVFNDAQAGLFDVVLSPDFEADQAVFLAYACGTASANHLCVARGQLQGMALEGVVEIFRAKPAKQGSAHYGGRMAWLPDGTLIVTLGDGFDYREQAQDLSSHLGKIVRLNPDGSAPADNPFVGRDDALPEIYSYGHRNVQGLVYDSVEGLLIAHEHGPRGGDEINIIEPGHNYGWPVITHGIDYTGAMITPFVEREGMEQPLLHWTPSIAPSGMTRYRGELFPGWQGNLLVALPGFLNHMERGIADLADACFDLDRNMPITLCHQINLQSCNDQRPGLRLKGRMKDPEDRRSGLLEPDRQSGIADMPEGIGIAETWFQFQMKHGGFPLFENRLLYTGHTQTTHISD
jgi:glucose/arabinose dehydrogenase